MLNLSIEYLSIILIAFLLISLKVASRTKTADGFFSGKSSLGASPNVLMLTFSQVTTWIFARSLLNALTLGYLFGIAGALAYSAYYLSFLTGGFIVKKLRQKHNVTNIQSFIHKFYGTQGEKYYNVLIAMRLLTEVFANLLVVGLLFGVIGSNSYIVSIITVTVFTLIYSMSGGLRASLKTDIFQAILIIFCIITLFISMVVHPSFDLSNVLSSSPDLDNPGWILLVVALLQILSYPMHDPVMMDRGFLSDDKTTQRSFIYSFLLSFPLIFAFGLLGVFVNLASETNGSVLTDLQNVLGAPMMFIVAIVLIVSSASTLDSTYSSASKLVAIDILNKPSLTLGRIVMAGFSLGGLLLTLFGNNDIYDAVAISGTISLSLTPVIIFNLFFDKRISIRSYIGNFFISFFGALTYFTEKSGYTNIFGKMHSYTILLILSIIIIISGFVLFYFGQDKSDFIREGKNV